MPETDTMAGALKKTIRARVAEGGGRGRVSPHSSLKIKEVSQHKAGLSGFPVGAGKGMDGGQELTTQGEEPWYLDIC